MGVGVGVKVGRGRGAKVESAPTRGGGRRFYFLSRFYFDVAGSASLLRPRLYFGRGGSIFGGGGGGGFCFRRAPSPTLPRAEIFEAFAVASGVADTVGVLPLRRRLVQDGVE